MEIQSTEEDDLIQKALKLYNRKKKYDRKYQDTHRKSLNKYREYHAKLDKKSEQYQNILAKQRIYYNNVYKLRVKARKEQNEIDEDLVKTI
jgi:hypothetical protein